MTCDCCIKTMLGIIHVRRLRLETYTGIQVEITKLIGHDETLARLNAGIESIQLPADA